MNKRVAKPKDDEPLLPDDDVTEAQMDQYFRDNRAAINEKIQEALDDIAHGRVAPMESLPELLKAARKHHKART